MSRLPTAQPRPIRKSTAQSDCRSATALLSAIRCRTANSGISGPRVGVLASIAATATLAPTATATALKIAEESRKRGSKICAKSPPTGAVVSLRSSRAIRCSSCNSQTACIARGLLAASLQTVWCGSCDCVFLP
eukprot:scaffold11424_cov65-Phaeocystis_antarctica.AAC.3